MGAREHSLARWGLPQCMLLLITVQWRHHPPRAAAAMCTHTRRHQRARTRTRALARHWHKVRPPAGAAGFVRPPMILGSEPGPRSRRGRLAPRVGPRLGGGWKGFWPRAPPPPTSRPSRIASPPLAVGVRVPVPEWPKTESAASTEGTQRAEPQ